MRRLLTLTAAAFFVITISNVYSCEGKHSGAKASKASSDAEKSTEMVKTTEASYDGCPAMAQKADYSKTVGKSCCPALNKSKASNANVQKMNGKSYCPAKQERTAPKNKDIKIENINSQKAETGSEQSPAPEDDIPEISSR